MSKRRLQLVMLAWLAALALLLTVAVPRTHFAASVTELLPGRDKETQILGELAETEQGRQLTVRLHVDSGPLSEQAIRVFMRQLETDPAIEQVWRATGDAFNEPARVVFAERYLLLLPHWLHRVFPQARPDALPDAEAVARLLADELDEFLQAPESLALTEIVPSDPFLLMRWLKDTPAPVSADAGDHEAFLWAQQSASPFREEGQQPVFTALERALHAARAIEPGLQMEFTGVARFAEASKTAIKGEIQRLNLLCLLLVLAISLLAVRDWRSILRIMGVVMLAMLTAAAVVIALFPSVHILALVVGSILAGIAVDYGFHLVLVEKHGLPRRLVTKAVVTGSLSSAAGFITLLWAPLPFLQQVGAFVGTGLIAALLAAFVVRPGREASQRFLGWRPAPFSLPRWAGILLLLLLLPGVHAPQWSDHISDLEYPLPAIREQDARLRSGSGEQHRYAPLLVTGSTLIEARDNLARLEALPGSADFLHAGTWIPTLQDATTTQAVFREMSGFAEALSGELEARDYLPEAFAPFFAAWRAYLNLPIDPQTYSAALGHLAESLPGPFRSMLHSRAGLSWFLLLAPPGAEPPPADWIHPLDQARMLDRVFAGYRESMSAQAVLCLLVLAGGILAAYGLARGAAALAIPVSATLAACGIAGYLGLQPGLFHLVGAFLAFCIGLDYALFAVEAHRTRSRLPASISISCATTAGVFGVLSTSSIPAVHALGLTVLVVLALTLLLILCGWPLVPVRRPLARTHFESLPHGEEALLIGGIREVRDNEIDLSLVALAGQARPVECLLEVLAQGAAVLVAHETAETISRRSGMLVVVQEFHSHGDAHIWNEDWTASVASFFPPRPGLLMFRGHCTDENGREVLRATFSIYIP